MRRPGGLIVEAGGFNQMKTLIWTLLVSCFSMVPAFSQSPHDCNEQKDCQAAVDANPRNSLVHYRLGQTFFQNKQWQLAADEFREALRGDRDPEWTVVWSHINLGKIFDVTGQRERALNEYRMAHEYRRVNVLNDDAQAESSKYIGTPFKLDSK
jgi:tetratricopeptide (TPR) repeat protein